MKRVRAIILLDNKIVLIKRIKTSGSYWVFPGGGVELGESNKEAMIRECKEELGVDIKVDKLLFKREFNNKVEYFYLCFIKSGVLGSGRGPEYQLGTSYNGEYKVVTYPVKNIKKLNLKPIEIRDGVIKLINKFSKVIKSNKQQIPS